MSHPTFDLIRTRRIPSLNISVQEYVHRSTRARHYHLASEDANNAFLVAFPTVPQNSTGVAHILEHTTLCGSERFPVRDPFFMMIRRSLNTFMNAFTGSDWTAYPFASQNRKDFDNLLQVYLDAVFFPRLDPLDFAQEGHRLELVEPDRPDSPLAFKGVVYNEMKGAMSSPTRQVWQTLQSHLFPTTTYHYNSGGDPEEIPKLTYEQLRAFHEEHYHPSNAVFMTYGCFPVQEHQVRMEEWALRRFGRREINLTIPDERRYAQPIAVEGTYTLDPAEDSQRKTHVVLGWLLGHTADLRELMRAHLLAGVLLDNSASPLRHALETSELGTAPSDLCGLEDSMRQACFVAGIEGSDPDKAEAVQQLILDVLHEVATRGVPQEQVESVLHQLELSQREIGGGRFPYGLQLMVRALPAILHEGDPVGVLDIDPVLNDLRTRIRDPEFVKGLARQMLLDNLHRVRLTMAPDTELAARRAAAETERLATIRASLTPEDIRRLAEQAAALKARQARRDDPDILPKVGLGDIPDDLKIPEGRPGRVNGMPAFWFSQGTNGLVYTQLVVDLPELEPQLVDDLSLFCECITEVGCGHRDYLETQAWQAAVSGGISARISLRAEISDVQRARGVFVLAVKGLLRNQEAFSDLLQQTFAQPRFDELSRLRDLVAQLRAEQEATVTDHGHALALAAASAGMGPCGILTHRWDGLEGIRRLKLLDQALDDREALRAFAGRLERIHAALLRAPSQLLVVSEETPQEDLRRALDQRLSFLAQEQSSGQSCFVPDPASFVVREGWRTSTEVSFCAKAYASVPQGDPDAPALTVLGPFLRNGFLHRAIREQGGAYGAGAGHSPNTGSFRFYSYRDPRLGETLADFDRALDWLHSEPHDPRQLEEAILGIISEIDRPESPAGEAVRAFFGSLHGRTPEQRRKFRHAVLQVTIDDLKRVAEQYLTPEAASIAVLSSPGTLERNGQLGLQPRSL